MEKHGRKVDRLKEEGQAYLQSKNAFCNKLVEKWRKTDIGWGLDSIANKNPQKARNVALLIENQEKYLKSVYHG